MRNVYSGNEGLNSYEFNRCNFQLDQLGSEFKNMKRIFKNIFTCHWESLAECLVEPGLCREPGVFMTVDEVKSKIGPNDHPTLAQSHEVHVPSEYIWMESCIKLSHVTSDSKFVFLLKTAVLACFSISLLHFCNPATKQISQDQWLLAQTNLSKVNPVSVLSITFIKPSKQKLAKHSK